MKHKAWFFASKTANNKTISVRNHLGNDTANSLIARTQKQFLKNMRTVWGDSAFMMREYGPTPVILERVT